MSPKLRASIHRILFATGALTATVAPVVAQETTEEIAEIVIVTGSYIKGTAEDAALPVDVISTEELEKQGAPSPVEMLKSLTTMSGVIGESNRFTTGRGQASQGSTTVNLRGFGADRSLVLLNGKRLASGDINLLPANAIARVEVLKDGGASTYGSDAIAGVVNYITKERVDGLEVSGDYRYIKDSDGDYNTGLAWGTTFGIGDVFISGNYIHRSELDALNRDWAVRSFAENPQGGWSTGSNPGAFRFFSLPQDPTGFTLGRQYADPACAFFGGTVVPVAATATAPAGNQCQTQFTRWDNLVEEQNTYQAYAQVNFDFSETTRLHVEAHYALTDVPDAGATPSGTTSRRITSTVLPSGALGLSTATNEPTTSPTRTSLFYVPVANPGFTGAYAPGAGFVPAGVNSTTLPGTIPKGAYITLNQWRPFLSTGNPAHDYEDQTYNFERENARFSTELSTEFGGISFSTSLSYGMTQVERNEVDIATGRLQLALRGLGGAGCNGIVAGQAGSTCQWFNPFANSIRTDVNGNPNPYYNAAADVNTPELVNWLEDEMTATNETRLGEFNVVLSGEMPWALPGGAMGWAAGAQYRHTWVTAEYTDSSNRDVNVCPDTPINGTTSCSPSGESPYNFLATYNPIDVDRGVYAGFGELSLPVTDSFAAQIAARFEDYGDQGGSSFDPKLSLKYQVIDQLAFRGSVGTTFRAPPQTTLIPDEAIAFVTIFNASRPVGTVGNPNLEPEESFQWSVGTILSLGGFRATVDFWRFDIDKLLTVEPSGGLVSLVFPNGATGANNCATVDPEFLASHFQFANNTCAANNILKITRSQINGAGLRNDGIDVVMDYTFDFGGNSLVLGASGTWIHSYETETLIIDGVTFETGFDGVGFLNQGTSLYALPEWRAQGYIDFNAGIHSIRWTTNWVDQYRDQRDGISRDGRTEATIYTGTTQDGRIVESSFIHNLTYRVELPFNTALLATVENIMDEDPSFARLELSYDPLTGYPLGRTFKLGFRTNFD